MRGGLMGMLWVVALVAMVGIAFAVRAMVQRQEKQIAAMKPEKCWRCGGPVQQAAEDKWHCAKCQVYMDRWGDQVEAPEEEPAETE